MMMTSDRVTGRLGSVRSTRAAGSARPGGGGVGAPGEDRSNLDRPRRVPIARVTSRSRSSDRRGAARDGPRRGPTRRDAARRAKRRRRRRLRASRGGGWIARPAEQTPSRRVNNDATLARGRGLSSDCDWTKESNPRLLRPRPVHSRDRSSHASHVRPPSWIAPTVVVARRRASSPSRSSSSRSRSRRSRPPSRARTSPSTSGWSWRDP